MNKREFLKTSAVLAGGAMLSRFTPALALPPVTNWGGNFTYSTANVHYPASIAELQQLVKKSGKIKGLGSRHCYNTIADSTENQVSLRQMNRVIGIDKKAHTVTVEAGIKYAELVPYLQQNGYALHNLASLPDITVAGACATGTHGSGTLNGNLATSVSAIEFVNAAGELVSMSRAKDGDTFNGVVIGLGALGILTKLTLNLEPAYNASQVVYNNLPMANLQHNFAAAMASGYSVSMFTNWKNEAITEIWVKSKIAKGGTAPAALPELFGAKAATQKMHPVPEAVPTAITEQMGTVAPWYEILTHFKIGALAKQGNEIQSEYFVPIEHAYPALRVIESLHEQLTPNLHASEMRTVAADDLWLSPCYKKTCVAFHTSWKQGMETVLKILPQIEEKLAPFNPIPHWGKVFTMPASVVQSRFERLNDFKKLVARHDPNGKFRNEFLDQFL